MWQVNYSWVWGVGRYSKGQQEHWHSVEKRVSAWVLPVQVVMWLERLPWEGAMAASSVWIRTECVPVCARARIHPTSSLVLEVVVENVELNLWFSWSPSWTQEKWMDYILSTQQSLQGKPLSFPGGWTRKDRGRGKKDKRIRRSKNRRERRKKCCGPTLEGFECG